MNVRDALVESDYYQRLIRERNAPVIVKNLGPQYGRVVFAARDFKQGEMLWRERPLISMQDSSSRRDPAVARACGHCMQFIGTLDEQLAYYDALIESNDFHAYKGVCQCQCGELYCSKDCQQTAWKNHHRLLCVGPLSEEHDLVKFKRFCIEKSDLFLLAAQGLCLTICTAANDNVSLDVARRPFDMLHHRRWQDIAVDRGDTTVAKFEREMHHCFALLRDGLLDVIRARECAMLDVARAAITLDAFSAFFQIFDCNNQAIGVAPPLARLWSRLEAERRNDDDDDDEHANDDDNDVHVVVKHEDDDDDDDNDDAHRTDGDEFEKETDSIVKSVDELFKMRVMRTAEALRMQDDGTQDDKPHDYLHTNVNEEEAENEDEQCCDDEECEHDHDHDDDDENEMIDDGEEAPFRRLEGVGMFPLSATVNHSCQPNCVVVYGLNFEARIYARKNIAKDEQLYHTYIQESEPYETRTEHLKVYGFKCDCKRCQQRK